MNEKKTDGKLKNIFSSVSAEEKVSGKMAALLAAMFVSFMLIIVCVLNLVHSLSTDKKTADTDIKPDVTVTEPQQEEVTAEQPKATVTEYIIKVEQINPSEYEQIAEAEDMDGNQPP